MDDDNDDDDDDQDDDQDESEEDESSPSPVRRRRRSQSVSLQHAGGPLPQQQWAQQIGEIWNADELRALSGQLCLLFRYVS